MQARFASRAVLARARRSTWISLSRGRRSMSEAAVIAHRNWSEQVSSSVGTVLIIDDEAAIRESLETLLETEGYAVQSASSAEEGLARLGDGSFDLVLL